VGLSVGKPWADIPFPLHIPKNPKRTQKVGLDSVISASSCVLRLRQAVEVPKMVKYDQVFLKTWSRANSRISPSMPNHKPRLRGRPRRGSPWRPRRPTAPPSAQPPSRASTHHLELVPHSLSSALRVIHSLSMAALSHPNLPAPPGTSAAQNPPPSRDQPHMDHSSADTIHGEQLKDKLSILQGLVFELRRGVEDLQFRLELNNEKIELFLQLLSSLQAAIHTDAGGATSMHEPTDDIGGVRADERKEPGAPSHSEDDMMQSGEEHGKKSQ
jgi:hypothetical protein